MNLPEIVNDERTLQIVIKGDLLVRPDELRDLLEAFVRDGLADEGIDYEVLTIQLLGGGEA